MDRLRWGLGGVCLAVAACTLAPGVSAGEFNPVLSVGDEAPAWNDLPGVDDQRHSSKDLKSQEVLVVVFTCNSCPYAVDYEDRLVEFHRTWSDRKVALVAINVNRIESDRLDAMKTRAAAKQFAFPYLYDETQQIARAFGATYTPEFYVLDRERRIIYMGAMDDSPDGSKVTRRYVELAVEAALNGKKPAVAETVAVGCRVRYARTRRPGSR